MARDSNVDPPVSDAIAEGWAHFARSVLPTIGGTDAAQAHIAFHFGALYVLQIAQQVIADRSVEKLSLALGMLDAELEDFLRTHSISIQ